MKTTLKNGKTITLPDYQEIDVICTKTSKAVHLPVTHRKLTIDELHETAELKLGAKCSCGEIHVAYFSRMTDDREAAYQKTCPAGDVAKALYEPLPDYDQD